MRLRALGARAPLSVDANSGPQRGCVGSFVYLVTLPFVLVPRNAFTAPLLLLLDLLLGLLGHEGTGVAIEGRLGGSPTTWRSIRFAPTSAVTPPT
jgi:hypothetical protein